jgi:hypothetical protein
MSPTPPTQPQNERYGIGAMTALAALYGMVQNESFHSFNTLTSLFPLQQRVLRSFVLPSWAMRRAANMVTTVETIQSSFEGSGAQLGSSSESA